MVVGIGVVVVELVVGSRAVDDELVVGAGVVLLDVVGAAVVLDDGNGVDVSTSSEEVVP